MKSLNPTSQYHPGFTLMEVMISVSIFVIIVTIGIGSLMTILSTLKKTRADRDAMDSISFVMDTMTRRLRTGYDYVAYNGSAGIQFVDQDGGTVQFYTTTVVSPDGGYHLGLSMTDSNGAVYDITPPNMVIDSFLVFLSGEAAGAADGQPFVRLSLKGTVTNGRQQTPLSVQASVSQRYLDFDSNGPGGNLLGSGSTKTTGTSFTGGPRIPRTETPGIDAISETITPAVEIPPPTSEPIKAMNSPR